MQLKDMRVPASLFRRKNAKISRPVGSSLDDAPTGNLTLQRGEPSDAFVTGTTRSLQRRVLGLNFPEESTGTSKTKPPATKV